MASRAVLAGNSDGIGLATTHRLLKSGWEITGLSRSPSQTAAGNPPSTPPPGTVVPLVKFRRFMVKLAG